MGAMFIGQQYLQNVQGYSTLAAGAAIIPAVAVHGARRAAIGRLVEPRGARFTLLAGYVFCVLGFATMFAALGRGQPVLAGRARLRRSWGSASGWRARRLRIH